MSVIKANKHQVGSNVDASKNIVLEANVDGDLVISKGVHDGTLTEVLKVKNSGGVDSASVGYTPAGAGAVATTVQSKLLEFVSVLDFYANGVSGEKVDPTGVIDSTLGIQAAITYAQTRPTGTATVYLPAGTYTITDTLSISKDVRVIGDGGDASILSLAVGTAKPAILVQPAPAGYIWFFELAGFRINCKAGAVSGDGILVTAASPSAVSQGAIRDIQVRDFRDGINFAGTSSNEVYINLVENVKMFGGDLSGSGANDVRYGLKVSAASYNTFRNIEITGIGNAGFAVYAEAASSHFEQITTDGVAYVDSPWGVIDHWTVETIVATTPVRDVALAVMRLASLRAVTLIEVENAKCNYGIGIAPGSQGMMIEDVTIEQSAGARPNYPLTIPSESSGTVINWKGGGAFKVELYTAAEYMEAWRFINSLAITDREVGVRNVAAGGKPTASDKLRGQLLLEKGGTGVADVIYVCRKNSAEAYEWQALA